MRQHIRLFGTCGSDSVMILQERARGPCRARLIVVAAVKSPHRAVDRAGRGSGMATSGRGGGHLARPSGGSVALSLWRATKVRAPRTPSIANGSCAARLLAFWQQARWPQGCCAPGGLTFVSAAALERRPCDSVGFLALDVGSSPDGPALARRPRRRECQRS